MYRYTSRDILCYSWLQEKMHWKMSVQQVWGFMQRTLQVQRRRMLYLSLPIDSAEYLIRHANIEVYSEPNLLLNGQNKRTYTRKYVSEKTRILAYFTQCGISVVSPEIYTLLNKNKRHYIENN